MQHHMWNMKNAKHINASLSKKESTQNIDRFEIFVAANIQIAAFLIVTLKSFVQVITSTRECHV